MQTDLSLERLASHLDGTESRKVELKWDFHIDRTSRSGRTVPDQKRRKEFAKDVAALANSPAEANDQRGFILLGVKDRQHQKPAEALPPAFSLFASSYEVNKFGGRLQRIVANYLDPPPEVRYTEEMLPGKVELVGIIVVIPQTGHPLTFTKNMGEAHENDVAWTRRSSQDPYRDRLTRQEIEYLRRSHDDADLQIVLRRIEVLEERTAAPLPGAGTWTRPEAKRTPASLSAFVSLDEGDREAAVQSVQLASNLDDMEKQLYAQVLMGMLRDESPVVVLEAVKSLQHVDTPLAIEALLEVCRTCSGLAVYQALEALGQLGDRDTMFALGELKTLEDLPVFRLADEEERENFLQAVDEAIGAISERLEPSPDTYAEYVLKVKE